MYVILYEWDGRPPPKWYQWGRKHFPDLGVAAQDGVLVIRSRSTARAIYLLLRRGIEYRSGGVPVTVRPAAVELHELTPVEIEPSPADEVALDRLVRFASHSGRRMLPRQWIVECREEEKTFRTFGSGIVCCPNCGALDVVVRGGDA